MRRSFVSYRICVWPNPKNHLPSHFQGGAGSTVRILNFANMAPSLLSKHDSSWEALTTNLSAFAGAELPVCSDNNRHASRLWDKKYRGKKERFLSKLKKRRSSGSRLSATPYMTCKLRISQVVTLRSHG